MSNFADALQSKINLLEDEKEELEDALSRVSSKLEVLRELLQEESSTTNAGESVTNSLPSVPRGRLRKKKSSPVASPTSPEVLEEAAKLSGTSPEAAASIRLRGFSPSPRPQTSYGPGVRVDQNVRGKGPSRPNATISEEE